MVEAFSSPKMSTGTQVATHVRYSKGDRVDGEEKSQVEIQEHEDYSISPGLQENGKHWKFCGAAMNADFHIQHLK